MLIYYGWEASLLDVGPSKSQLFKLPRFECRDRVARPVPALFKSTGIGPGAFQVLFRRFYLCRDSLYENVNITYTNAFERPILALLKVLA